MSNVCQSHVSGLELEGFKNLRLETRDITIFALAIGSKFDKNFKNRYIMNIKQKKPPGKYRGRIVGGQPFHSHLVAIF